MILLNSGLPGLSYGELIKLLTGPVSQSGPALHRQAYHNLARCVATLVACRPQLGAETVAQVAAQLKNSAATQQLDPLKLFSLLALGEIGRR